MPFCKTRRSTDFSFGTIPQSRLFSADKVIE
jgi:hypothetical protein